MTFDIAICKPYFFTVQLEMSMKSDENSSRLYAINGPEKLGSILRIQSCSDEAIELAKCLIQWYRLSSQCSRREPIIGINYLFHHLLAYTFVHNTSASFLRIRVL